MKIVLVVFLVFVSLLIVPRMIMAFKSWRMKGKAAPVTHRASRKRIQAGKKTLLYFYTPSCGACKMQEPIIQQARKRHPEAVFKIDATRDQQAAASYGVMGVPFIAFVENGTIVRAAAGVQRESAIEGFLTQ